MYMGEVDGCLVISTFLPDGKASNSFAPAMEGHDAAAVVRFAPGAFPPPALRSILGSISM